MWLHYERRDQCCYDPYSLISPFYMLIPAMSIMCVPLQISAEERMAILGAEHRQRMQQIRSGRESPATALHPHPQQQQQQQAVQQQQQQQAVQQQPPGGTVVQAVALRQQQLLEAVLQQQQEANRLLLGQAESSRGPQSLADAALQYQQREQPQQEQLQYQQQQQWGSSGKLPSFNFPSRTEPTVELQSRARDPSSWGGAAAVAAPSLGSDVVLTVVPEAGKTSDWQPTGLSISAMQQQQRTSGPVALLPELGKPAAAAAAAAAHLSLTHPLKKQQGIQQQQDDVQHVHTQLHTEGLLPQQHGILQQQQHGILQQQQQVHTQLQTEGLLPQQHGILQQQQQVHTQLQTEGLLPQQHGILQQQQQQVHTQLQTEGLLPQQRQHGLGHVLSPSDSEVSLCAEQEHEGELQAEEGAGSAMRLGGGAIYDDWQQQQQQLLCESQRSQEHTRLQPQPLQNQQLEGAKQSLPAAVGPPAAEVDKGREGGREQGGSTPAPAEVGVKMAAAGAASAGGGRGRGGASTAGSTAGAAGINMAAAGAAAASAAAAAGRAYRGREEATAVSTAAAAAADGGRKEATATTTAAGAAAAASGSPTSGSFPLELSGTLAEIMQQLGKAVIKTQFEPDSSSTKRTKPKSAPAGKFASKACDGQSVGLQLPSGLGSSGYMFDQFDQSMLESNVEVPVADRCSTPLAVDISTPELESKYLMTEGLAFSSRWVERVHAYEVRQGSQLGLTTT